MLVPRPETELVVDRCLELLRDAPDPAVLDVGTGSGAIALAIASELPAARVTATDSRRRRSTSRGRTRSRSACAVEMRQGDLLDGLGDRRFDLIVSNPPYVSEQEIEGLEPEVAVHEPRLATVAGDGLDAYRRLLPDAREHLAEGGWLVLECGAGQADGWPPSSTGSAMARRTWPATWPGSSAWCRRGGAELGRRRAAAGRRARRAADGHGVRHRLRGRAGGCVRGALRAEGAAGRPADRDHGRFRRRAARPAARAVGRRRASAARCCLSGDAGGREPRRRFRALCGDALDRIGVRVPLLEPALPRWRTRSAAC